MKILLIAGFSNAEIREHLEFRKDSKLYHWLIKLFKLPSRVGEFRDHAPWITSIISSFETRADVELHVIGPHIRLKKSIEEFQLRGVTYHFFKSEFTSLLRITKNYLLWKRLQRSGYYTKKILDKVHPDLVVLSGAENPTIAVSILSASKYPRFCLCQTVYNNPERSNYSTPNPLNQATEMDVFRSLRYFGVFSSLHYGLLHKYNPNAIIFKYGYPSKGVLYEPTLTKKEYDFVNFALIHGSRKGTPDSIRAISIVKKKYPDVTLNIVGGCDLEELESLKQLCKDLEVDNNVSFTPFFEKRNDLLLHVQKSRFAVLPCKLDHIAGTMSQSMQLGLPIVVYKTTGTPSLNREKLCALIAEKGNIEELAQHMLALMDKPELAESLRKNAREFQEKKALFALKNGDRLIETFKAVISKEQYEKPIPQELLFNIDKDD